MFKRPASGYSEGSVFASLFYLERSTNGEICNFEEEWIESTRVFL